MSLLPSTGTNFPPSSSRVFFSSPLIYFGTCTLLARSPHHHRTLVLLQVQVHSTMPLCPLCRTPFEADVNLCLNLDLRDAIERMQAAAAAAAMAPPVNYKAPEAERLALSYNPPHDSHAWMVILRGTRRGQRQQGHGFQSLLPKNERMPPPVAPVISNRVTAAASTRKDGLTTILLPM